MHRYKYLIVAAVVVILVAASARDAHLDEKHGSAPPVSEPAPDAAMVEQQQPLPELPENVSVDDLIKQKPDKILTVKKAKKDIERWSFFKQLRFVPFFHNGKAAVMRVLSVEPDGFWDFLQRGDVILSINDKPIDFSKLFFGPADKEYSTFRVYRDNQVILIKVEKSKVSQSSPPKPAPDAAMVEQQRSSSRPPENVSIEDLIKQKPAKILTKKMSKKDIARLNSDEGYRHIRAVPLFHNGKAERLKVLSVKPDGLFDFLQRGDVILSIDDKPVDLRNWFSGFVGKENITFRVYRDNHVVLIKIEGT